MSDMTERLHFQLVGNGALVAFIFNYQLSLAFTINSKISCF